MENSINNIEDKTLQHKKRAFLKAYSEVGNITRAAELTEMARSNHYLWMKEDADYPVAFKDADEQASERLETEARRRAIQGTSKPVFHQGMECGVIQEYSDTLLIFLLKGANPAKYRDNVSMELGNKDGSPFELRALTDSDLKTRMQAKMEERIEAEVAARIARISCKPE